MNIIKLIFTVLFLISIGLSENRNHKTHHYKKHRKHSSVRHRTHQAYLGVNWHWNRRNHWWQDCSHHEQLIIIDDKKHDSNQESVLKIIEQIEKKAKLKDDGLITAEKYQIKKKVLLKRI